MSKGCAHITTTKSTECPEPRNQGGVIGHPISGLWEFPLPINWQLIKQTGIYLENEQLERPYFDQIII